MRGTRGSHGSADGVTRRGFVVGAVGAGLGGLGFGLAGGPAGPAATGVASEPAAVIPKRPFGRTGVDVPMVGVGGGSRFYSPIPDDGQAAELVRGAIERGLEYVETSANYGPEGLSERRIGLAMKTHRSRVFLETKVDARDYDGAMREMERSLERMNTDRLDLVLHHFLRDSEAITQVAGPGGAERAIRKLVDEKTVRFRGFSTHYPGAALEGMERLEPDAIQLPINATRVPDFEVEVLPAAASRGVAVIAMKTCGHGYFFPALATTPDRIDESGPPPEAWNRWDIPRWREYLHYALSLPIAIAVVGLDSHFTLDGVVAAATDFKPLTPAEKASVHERAQAFRSTGYWIPRG